MSKSLNLDKFKEENQSIQQLISISKIRIKEMSLEIHSSSTSHIDLKRNNSGGALTYNQLISTLEKFLNRQETINRQVHSIQSLNFLFNIYNYSKNLQLKSYLGHGHTQIKKLEGVIIELNQETLIHKETIQELNEKLSATKTQLNECIDIYEREMKEQRDSILKNQSVFNILLKSKLKQDFVIDSRNTQTQGKMGNQDWTFSQVLQENLQNRYTILPQTHEEAYYQDIIVDEDLKMRIYGYKSNSSRHFLYLTSMYMSFGLVYILYLWFPKFKVSVKHYPCCLRDADYILVENQYNQSTLLALNVMDFHGYLLDAFPKYRQEDSCPIERLHYFEYRYIRFIRNPKSNEFVANDVWRDFNWTSISQVIHGINDAHTLQQRRNLFCKNEICIQEKSTLQLLLDEVLHPFFIFQIGSMILWSLDNYYQYATCIFIISCLSILFTLMETRGNILKLQDLSKFNCLVRVWRLGVWTLMESSELVPGDVYELTSGSIDIIPADGVLLSGDCIINESMLTGESLPISKSPISDSELISLDFEKEDPATLSSMSRYFVFSGTKVIRSRSSMSTSMNTPIGSFSALDTLVPSLHSSEAGAQGALVLVVRTGFNTTKGNLIRSMLFPKPNKFKFYRDSFRFIGVLALIALLGFLASLYNFYVLNVPWTVIIVRALDLFTIVVPPALPATMAIGTSFAINRLKRANIFCISPPRVNICGKIDLMCFDKTGTLTREGLDVLGYQFTLKNLQDSHFKFSHLYLNSVEVNEELQEDVQGNVQENVQGNVYKEVHGDTNQPLGFIGLQEYPQILIGMACCHSIKQVHDKLVGDPMDLKMFECTNWKIQEGDSLFGNLGTCTLLKPPPNSSLNYTVLLVKTFDFVSGLRRMSVIVKKCLSENLQKSFCESQDFQVYVKGAPEVLLSICVPETLPIDYNEQLRYYTHHGYRVIAIATRSLTLNPLGVLNSKRSDIEKDLHFVGFLIFENKLKPKTQSVISTLHQAGVRQVMVTGDNVLTSISVSKECGLVDSNSRIYVPRFVTGTPIDPNAQIVWEILQDEVTEVTRVDGVTFQELSSCTLSSIQSCSFSSQANTSQTNAFQGNTFNAANTNTKTNTNTKNMNDYHLAITGDVFSWMLDFASESSLSRMLLKCQIYARMSPDQKHFLVERLQNLGYCVGFTGDGSNDCGALKNADVGLSLSEAEASVAAPFTSREKELSCVLDIIREGRGALVTSFCCFKYMALYSLIQFTTVSLLYSKGNNLGDGQYMYIDLFVIIPIAVFMGQSKPSRTLSSKRPTASLVSKKVLTSLVGQILIQSCIQIGVFVWTCRAHWYVPSLPSHESDSESMFKSMDNTILFYLSCFQYMIVAFVYNQGAPFRESFYKNVPFILSLSFLCIFSTWMLFSPIQWIQEELELVVLPWQVQQSLVFIIFLNFMISWFCEVKAFSWISFYLDKIVWSFKVKRLDVEELGMDRQVVIQRAKWKEKNKFFKIIRHQLESERGS